MSRDKKVVKSSPPVDDRAQEQEEEGTATLFVGAKRALIGGLLAGGIALGGQYLVGRVYSGTEARRMLEAFIPSARSVGTAAVTGAATILALMLTMISLSRHATSQLESIFFKRVERIGLLSSIALATGVLLLLVLSIPLQESDKLPGSWYSIVYYVLIALTAAVSALLITVVLMLYNAMQSLIKVLRQGEGSQQEGDRAKNSGRE